MQNSFFRFGWLHSTRLNYLLIALGCVGIFFGFSFNFNKLFEIESSSYFTGINVSITQFALLIFAIIFLLRSSLVNIIISLFLLFYGIVLNLFSGFSFAQFWWLIITWSSLIVWTFLIIEIHKTNLPKQLKFYGLLILIGYFCLDYLNFLLPIPVLFLATFWLWAKSTKPLKFVGIILLTILIINLIIAIYQIISGNFLGLSWLGENRQILELARQHFYFLNHDTSIIRGYGLLPHPNNLAMLASIILFCSQITNKYLKDNNITQVYKVSKIFSILLVLLTFSRLGYFLLIVFFLINFNFNKYFKKLKTKFILFGVGFLSVVTITVIWLGRFSSDLYRIDEFVWWKDAILKLNFQQLLFGSGIGSSSFILQKTLNLPVWANQPAHFGLINWVVEIGVIPLATIILLPFIVRFKLKETRNFSEHDYNNIENKSKDLIWLTSFGKFSLVGREEEVFRTLKHNINLNIFSYIYIFCEDKTTLDKFKIQNSYSNNIKFILTLKQLTIQEMFDQLKPKLEHSTIIFSNSDIQFSLLLKSELKYLKANDFWALTRYQDGKISEEFRMNKLDESYSTSQDVWISNFKNWNFKKNYCLGNVATDNLLNFQAFRAGLNIKNPSLEVITNHFHSNNQKVWLNKAKQHGWRLFISPSKISRDSNYEIIWE